MDKAAIYCRLSKEDYDKFNEGDESESISNQKMLLTDYAIKNGYFIYNIYVDEDYSGLYHDRPAFDRLIQDAKAKKFNIILAKTQSRFTRNMEHAEKYLNNIFPMLGIRFIGVIDGVDTSLKSNKKARQINSLINEWYSEDLSENIRAVFREKMSKGQFIGSFACYGYRKNPDDHHKLLPDEPAASVVRRIFDYCCNGYGVRSIAKKLTDDKVPTPTAYKHLQGLKFYNPNSNFSSQNEDYQWSTTTIKRILTNEMYTGVLIQGREKKLSYKSKKVILTPKKEWVYIEDNHEPLISKEIFQKAAEELQKRRKSCNFKAEPHLFAGKVKCAQCKNTMVKTSGRSRGGYEYLICPLSRRSRNKDCTRHSIRLDLLKQIIEKKLGELLTQELSNKLEAMQYMLPVQDYRKALQKLNRSIEGYENEITECKQSLANLYIDKTKGLINDSEFLSIKDILNQRIQNALEKLHNTESQLQDLSSGKDSQRESFKAIQRKIFQNELTFDMIQLLIKDIYIWEKNENQQIIEVHWSF